MSKALQLFQPFDVSPLLSVVTPNTPDVANFWSEFYSTSEGCKQVKKQWVDKTLLQLNTTLTSSITSGATSVTLDNPSKLKLFASATDHNFYIVINNHAMLVTAWNSGTGVATVTPAQLGTTAAAATAGDTVYIKYIPAETADYNNSFNMTERGTGVYNVIQKFEYQMTLSDLSIGQFSIGDEGKLSVQVKDRIQQLKTAVAQEALIGLRNEPGGTSTDTNSMGGLRYYASQNATASTFGKAFIETEIGRLRAKGADTSKLIMIVGDAIYQKATAMKQALVTNGGFSNSESSLKSDLLTYEYADSRVKIMYSSFMPNKAVAFTDKSKFSFLPLDGMSLMQKDLAPSGTYKRVSVYGYYTTIVRNGQDCHTWYSNVT